MELRLPSSTLRCAVTLDKCGLNYYRSLSLTSLSNYTQNPGVDAKSTRFKITAI